MEFLYFVLGIVSVGFLYSVVGVFKLKKEVIDLRSSLDYGSLNFRDDVDSLHDRMNNEINEIYRTIDSRVDKLENRLTNVV